MGTIKRKWRRWAASGLAAMLLITNLPLSTIAEANAVHFEKEILYFTELAEDVALQEVVQGTPLDDLRLPKKVEAVISVETIPEVEPDTIQEIIPEGEPETIPESSPEATPEGKSETTLDEESETISESEPEGESETISESKLESTSESGTETVAETKPESTSESGTEIVAESKPESTSETEPEITPDIDSENSEAQESEIISAMAIHHKRMPRLFMGSSHITVNSLSTMATGSDAAMEKDSIMEDTIDDVNFQETFTEKTVMAAVKWEPEPVYDPEIPGDYVFTAVLKGDTYHIADDIAMPEILVQVIPAEEGIKVLSWEWNDPEGTIKDGQLALPVSNEQQQIDFHSIVSKLPGTIFAVLAEEETKESIASESNAETENQAEETELPVTWSCDDYKQDEAGNWLASGTFLFNAELPEDYALSADAEPLEITVRLGDRLEEKLFRLSETIDGVEIVLTAKQGVFPEGATLSVKKIIENEKIEQIEAAIQTVLDEAAPATVSDAAKETDRTTVEETVSFDIKVMGKNDAGTDVELQPIIPEGMTTAEAITVTFKNISSPNEKSGEVLEVYHVDEGLTSAEPITAEIKSDEGEVIINPEHFSLYTLATVKASRAASGSLIAYYDYAGNFNNLVSSGGVSVSIEENRGVATSSYGTASGTDRTYLSWTGASTPGYGQKVTVGKELNAYSVALRFSYGTINSGWTSIINFANCTKDSGFYFKSGMIQFYPIATGSEVFSPNQILDMVITRKPDGEFTVYTKSNGTVNQQIAFTDTSGDTKPYFNGGKSILHFFRDNDGGNEYTSSGKIYSIKIWDYALSEEEIGVAADPITLTYKKNDGTTVISTTNYNPGTQITVANAPADLSGGTFQHWLSSDGSTYAPGSRFNIQTATTLTAVIKQDKPAAPTLSDSIWPTTSSLTLASAEGCEYGIQKSSSEAVTWQDSPVFTGLDAGMDYTFYQRMKQKNAYNLMSDSSAGSVFSTYPELFSTLEIREGSAEGSVVVNLLDNSSVSEGWTLIAGADYYLCAELNRWPGIDHIQLRYGNTDSTYNGVTFANPPGGGYTEGDISHDYFDRLTAYTDYEEPAYGPGSAKLSLRDGVMTYHIKNGQTKAVFSVGLVVNDAVYDGGGFIADAIGISVGRDTSGAFVETAAKSIDLKVGDKNPIRSCMVNATASAELGGIGGSVSATALINDVTTDLSAALFDTFTVDVTYPKGANLEYGFGSTFVKANSAYGTISLSEAGTESTVDGKVMVTKKLTVTKGYKLPTAAMKIYFRLDFPAGAGFTAGKYTLSLSNHALTIGGKTVPLKTAGYNQTVTYTVTEAGNDATAMAALNRPDVYNHTIDMNPGDYLAPLGSATISNGNAGSSSPFDKTYEATFNNTDTAVEITMITIPLGDKTEPVITWEGKDASGGTVSGVLTQEQILAAAYENPGNLAGSTFLLLYAEDLGIKSFTKVTAEIGKLRPAYRTNRSTNCWLITYNKSGAYGHFTTGENGLEVKNTFKLYNTDPALRDRTNGDLTVTTSATSTNELRMGMNSDTIKLGNTVLNTDSAVAAGETAKISGTVYPYHVPRAAYDTSVSPVQYATSIYLKNPVFYLTLPSGLTPDQDGISFSLTNYNDRGKKTGASSSLSYTLTQTANSGGITTYKITLPEGTAFGYYDGEGNYSQLKYSLAFETEKSLATQRYRLNDLVILTSANGFGAVPYGGQNNAVLASVKEDAGGVNNGAGNVSGIAKDKDDAPVGFGVQQQAEIVVESAISVSKVNSSPVTPEWASYSPSNPNSVSMMGNTCEGQVRLIIKNTSEITGSDFKLLLPIPRESMDLGGIFMTAPQGFGLTMENTLAGGSANGFTVRYAKINGSFENVSALWDGANTWQTVTDQADANALLITANSLAKGEYPLYLDYTVSNGRAGASNVWQPVYAYTVEHESRQKTGGAVAGAVAGSKVSGIVFADGDGNGIMDGGDSGVSGIKVTALDAQGRTASATTDVDGKYEFTAVRESALTLTFTVDSGKNLRFHIQPNLSGAGTVSSVTPSTNGLSASRRFYASGSGTVNAAMSGFVTLRYDGNGSTGGVLPANSEYMSGDTASAAVKPDSLKKTGYRFTGWNTQADGNGTACQPGAAFTIDADTTLYAQWAVTDYLITFNYRGATTGNTETGRRVEHNTFYGGVKTGNTFSNPLPTPAKPGYAFTGWTRTATGTRANVANGTKFTLGVDTILYALWTPKNDYTVKYDTVGGSTLADKTGVAWNGTVLPAASPVKTGFVFDGWTHLDSGTAITDLTRFNDLAADDTATEVTLTAKWRPKNGFTVKYDANGGTGSLFNKTGVAWTDQNLLPAQNPTRDNYAFDGWTFGDTAQTVTAADSYGELAKQETVMVITLKAAWKEITDNVVRYDAAGGTPVKDKNGVKASDPVLPDQTTARKGYTFDGWYHGGTPVTADMTYGALAASGQKSITLTAHWTQKTYTVKYETGNGTTISDATKTWLENGLLPSVTLTKDGHTFGGWYHNGTAVMASDTVSTLLPADDADTLTLTAKWLEKTYTVLYDTQGGNYISPRANVRYTAKNLLPDVSAVRTGYVLEKWTARVGAATVDVSDATALNELIAAGTTAQVVTLTANWTAKTGYTVVYDTNGGTPVANKTGVDWEDSGLLPGDGNKPTRGGYELTGWLCGRIAVTDATAFSKIASSDADGTAVTLVAQWAERTDYTVRYVTDSETNIEDKTGVRWNERLLLPNINPEREGHAFLGWVANAGETGEKMVSNADSYAGLVTDASQSVLILTAKWEAKAHYNVKYDTDGGGSIADKNNVEWTNSSLLPTEIPAKYGYAFGGWTYTRESGEVVTVTNGMTYASLAGRDTLESITLTATWTPRTYTVRYDTDGAGEIPPMESVLWMEAPILPESDPVKTGYRVAGWYYEGRRVETEHSLSDVVLEDSENVTEITLKLRWEERAFTVHYDADGGSAVADRSVSYTTDNLLPDSATYRKGYAFNGWYYGDTLVKAPETTVSGSGDGETTVTTPGTGLKELLGASADSMSELTLTARWTANTGYQVHYDTAGGSFAASRTGLSWTDTNLMPVTVPTKSGYTLSGWKCGGTDVKMDTAFGELSASDTPGSAITLLAVWTEKATYTVHYDKNGATSADIPDKTGVAWTQADLLPTPNPTRTGYAFGGWKLGEWQVSSETAYATLAGMDDTVNSVELKAVWIPIRDNTVKYDTDGGSVLADKTGVVWDEADLLPENPTKLGYTFTGWTHGAGNTPVTNTTKYSDLAETAATKEITLKALWTPKTYTVTYDTGGGSAIADKTDVKWVDKALLPAAKPTKEHFVFAGWKCGDALVDNNNTFESLAVNDAVTVITLTAQWTPKEYTVKYDTDGGSAIADRNVYWDSGAVLPDSVPMKRGMVFHHWEHNGSTVAANMIYGQLAGAGSPSAITLKAVYTQTPEDTGGVEGSIITDTDGKPIANVKVSVHLGGTVGTLIAGPVLTGADGKFSFYGLPYGIYTLVAQREIGGKLQTITKIITISEKTADGTMVMPSGERNTIVEIKPGTPAAAADGLEKLFKPENQVTDTEQGVTAADHQAVENGGRLEIRLTIESKSADDAGIAGDIEKIKSHLEGNYTLLPFDLAVIKTVTDVSGNTASTGLKELPTLIDIVIPLSQVEGKTIQVLRVHKGEVQALPYTSDSMQETFAYAGGNLHLQARMFSTYVIAYANKSGGGNNPGGGGNNPGGGGGNGGGSGSGDSYRYYTITLKAGEGGGFLPDKAKVSVREGDSAGFDIIPDAGYVIEDVKVDGSSIGVTGSYVFRNVRADYVLSASFQKAAAEPENPTISDTPEVPETPGQGDNPTAITPNPDGNESDNGSGGSTTSKPAADIQSSSNGEDTKPDGNKNIDNGALEQSKADVIEDLIQKRREAIDSLPDTLTDEQRQAAIDEINRIYSEAEKAIREADSTGAVTDIYNQAVHDFAEAVSDAGGNMPSMAPTGKARPFIMLSALLALVSLLSAILSWRRRRDTEEEKDTEEDTEESRNHRHNPMLAAGAAVLAILIFLLTTGWHGIAFANWWTIAVAVPAAVSLWLALKQPRCDSDENVGHNSDKMPD